MTDEVKTTPQGIVVPLTDFPGEYIVFAKEWTFGDIDNIGKFIPGTAGAIDQLLNVIIDWSITDVKGNQIVFDSVAMKKDHSLLYNLSARKARAITMSAFVAYNEAGKVSPLQS